MRYLKPKVPPQPKVPPSKKSAAWGNHPLRSPHPVATPLYRMSSRIVPEQQVYHVLFRGVGAATAVAVVATTLFPFVRKIISANSTIVEHGR